VKTALLEGSSRAVGFGCFLLIIGFTPFVSLTGSGSSPVTNLGEFPGPVMHQLPLEGWQLLLLLVDIRFGAPAYVHPKVLTLKPLIKKYGRLEYLFRT
jgi:hypothetical protein